LADWLCVCVVLSSCVTMYWRSITHHPFGEGSVSPKVKKGE
jgi:hypothetical protein